MTNAEQEKSIALRDVAEDDLEKVLGLNEASVPAVNSVDLDLMRWFAANAAYFRIAMLGEDLAGFMIGLRPGTSYASPNYRWFCDAYADFGYVDRIAIATTARRLGLATRFYRDFEANLPVSADGELVGMLSDRDIRRARGRGQLELSLVSDVMSPDLRTVEAGTGLACVAQKMLTEKISAVPVVDASGTLVGIASLVDLMLGCAGVMRRVRAS